MITRIEVIYESPATKKRDARRVEFSGSEAYAMRQALDFITYNAPIKVIAIATRYEESPKPLGELLKD